MNHLQSAPLIKPGVEPLSLSESYLAETTLPERIKMIFRHYSYIHYFF